MRLYLNVSKPDRAALKEVAVSWNMTVYQYLQWHINRAIEETKELRDLVLRGSKPKPRRQVRLHKTTRR